ncbi:hypothetical protein AB0M02_28020 [Actinoplanes sp. NPDC051861]|uniref:hypothetical protein n=1 Tax=Actinoplanes sp. NPDC051861 TaxID=3155170 RepID=UPI0034216038
MTDLRTVPDDPGEVCGLIAGFLEDWCGTVVVADGEREEEVAAAERRLGFSLPVALRWVFVHVAGVGQDPLVPPARLAVDGHGVLTYREENQGCARWGIRPGRPDPAVVWTDGRQWRPYLDRISVDLLAWCLSEAMTRSGAHVLWCPFEEQPASLTRLGIPDHVFWAEPGAAPVRWFRAGDCLVRNDGDIQLIALGKTKEDVRRTSAEIRGEWRELDD